MERMKLTVDVCLPGLLVRGDGDEMAVDDAKSGERKSRENRDMQIAVADGGMSVTPIVTPE